MIFMILTYLSMGATLLLIATCGATRHLSGQVAILQRQLDDERHRHGAADSVIARRNHLLGIAEPFSRN